MSIEFECGNCGTVLRTADETAGKAARCPNCQNVVPIPMPEGQPSVQAENPYRVQPSADFPETGSISAGSPYAQPQHRSTEDFVGSRVRAKITPAAIVSLVISFIAMAFWLLAVAGGIGTIIERGGREKIC